MIKINYPEKKPAIKEEAGREMIFCICRKRWVVLTPEEWVRQNFLLFLIETMRYPASLIAVEKQVMVGELKKRFDIVLFKNEQPLMVIECKEMEVQLSQKTIEQVIRYNMNLQARYFVITNGVTNFVFEKAVRSFEELREMPWLMDD